MPATISHYRLEGEIGRGGMGVVYRAVDTRLQRAVALKVLTPGAGADPARSKRLIQEARAASALNHPNIVTVYEVDEQDGTAFIAMELVQGTPLDALLANGPLTLAQTLCHTAQIAEALEAAHAAGIVHRDIKPANIVVGASGAVKVLDFGLAKLVERSGGDATISIVATNAGTVVGTAAYMSPEQAEGRAVDARTDIFSLGAVMFEMLTGRRAFAGSSEMGVISAILRDDPPPIRTITSGVPLEVDMIVRRALAKDPVERFPNAATMGRAIAGVRDRLMRPKPEAWRRPSVLVAGAAVVVAAVAFGGWQRVEARRSRWARLEAVPEIERLNVSGRSMNAVRLAREAEPYAPEAVESARKGWLDFHLVTEPQGATIEVRNYSDLEGPWEPLGVTPLSDRVKLPVSYYRVRISKPGYRTLQVSSMNGRVPVKLTPESSAAPGMVFVPGGQYATGAVPGARLPAYWIDQLEVTNGAYRKFVEQGGYSDAKYWKEPFRDDERILSFDQAMARFKDSTGRAGPATWELGSFPEGQADFPVSGISWFEAAAYAEFTGKSLPTLYHWFNAAGIDEVYSDILQLSNFDGKGPSKAGARAGLGPWGTLDMAGNVKEWCANQVGDRQLRYILGGAWNEPSYRFSESDAQDPWGRRDTYGLRLVRNLGDVGATAAPIDRVARDPKTVVPVSNDLFEVYKRFYDYDRTALDPRVEAVDDSSLYWRKERVSFLAAYGNQRVPAYLFLPKNAQPPYQTIVVFPSAYAMLVPNSTNLDVGSFEFLMRSGRAVIYPVYQGTFERKAGVQAGAAGFRDMTVQWGKDFFRAVDYLDTRKEIDTQRLGYYSLSMGAYFGPIPVALDKRIKAAVFVSGGLRYGFSPQVQPANFMPRVTVPVLLVNGKDDFGVSDAERRRFFDLLGTAGPLKKHVVLEGGHVPQDIRGLFREALAWYDAHLGVVK